MLGTIAVRMMSIVCLGLAKKFFNRSSFKESFVVMCVSWCVQLRSIVMCTPRYGKGSSGLRISCCPVLLGLGVSFMALSRRFGWVGARETDKVVCKSPAASAVFGFVVGCAGISVAVHVSIIACMEPTKQRFHVDQEQEWRQCVSLYHSSFNCHAQSSAATNCVTEQLNWLTVESFFMSC